MSLLNASLASGRQEKVIQQFLIQPIIQCAHGSGQSPERQDLQVYLL